MNKVDEVSIIFRNEKISEQNTVQVVIDIECDSPYTMFGQQNSEGFPPTPTIYDYIST